MKLSALQQSPNLLLNALQAASSTMVAASTSITDPLPQSTMADPGTVGPSFGGNITALAVASTASYKVGEFYVFDAGINSSAFIIFAMIQPTMIVAEWLGTPPPISTVGNIGYGNGTASNTSYLLTQGQYLIIDAMQQSTTTADFIHVVVKCQAVSVLAVQGLGIYVQVTNQYDPTIYNTTTIAPVSVRQVSPGEYEAEYIYHVVTPTDIENAQLSDGAVKTTLLFTNNFAGSTYISEVRAYTRPDSALTLPGPYDYVYTPTAPVISSVAGDINLGVFISSAPAPLVGDFPSPIKAFYWELATDNLFNTSSLLGVYTASSPVGNSDSLRMANVADFNILGAFPGGTYYVRCRAINEIGLVSAWSTTVSFVYTPNTPVATLSTSTDLLTGDMTITLTESNFTRTENLPFNILIQQSQTTPGDPAVTIATISDTFIVGETSKIINIAQFLAYYELDAGVVLVIAQQSDAYFVDGASIPIYTKQNEVEKTVSANYVKPQQYVPFADSYAGDPNINPTPASAAALPGQVTQDYANGLFWIKSITDGTWYPIGSMLQRSLPVSTSAGTYTVTASDNGATLVFNENTPITIRIPNQLGLALPSGFTFNFRNKGTAQITVATGFADILQGAGATTVNANKVASCYLENRIFLGTGSTWVTVGDMVP